MKLTIHPRSLWLAYDLRRIADVQSMLPSHLRVAPVRLLESDVFAKPRLLMNCYDVSSRWMTGSRIEVQTFVEDKETKTVHLCILDCITNTMDWNPLEGVKGPTAIRREKLLRRPFSIARPGETFSMHFSTAERDPNQRTPLLSVQGTLAETEERPTSSFVVDANRVCYFHHMDTRFPMEFEEEEVQAPVRRLSHLKLDNQLWRSYRGSRWPSHAFVHPHPMTFRVEVPGLWYDL